MILKYDGHVYCSINLPANCSEQTKDIATANMAIIYWMS